MRRMRLRLYHAKILTMEENREIFEGEVWIEDSRILYVGTGEDKEEFFRKSGKVCMLWDEEIDCQGNLLMPGFKNAHTHSGMTFLRSFADDMPLDDWLHKQIFPAEAKLTPKDITANTRLAVLEYLTSGITAIFDMYVNPEAVGKGCEEMGMRCVLVSGLNDFVQTPEIMEQQYLTLNRKDSLVSFMLGFHAEYTCSKELLGKVAELAGKYKAPVFTHLCETKKEVAECVKRYGMTPPLFLDSLGIFDYGGGGYHGVYMSEKDMELWEKKKLHIVTNPASNLKLASGIAPIKEYERRGINVAIGTDGPASNNCLDMFREMFLVTGLSKVREEDAAAVDAVQVLKMATVGGAKAMGLTECDVLAAGKKADMILLDLHMPNMQPFNHIVKNIVYSGSKQNVKMTMIDGKILYRDGKFYTDFMPEEIYEEVNGITKRIKSDLGKE